MKIIKMETNFKRNLFSHTDNNIKTFTYSEKLENQIIQIYPNIEYQTFFGFGGACTESASIAINSLPNELSENLLNEYFSTSGLNYQFCRLPIGSSDFSASSCSYSYKNDLNDFPISRDLNTIIPIIHRAQKLNPTLKFLSSPWSPPAYMKDNNSLYSGGKLQKNFYQTYANYLAYYIKAYAQQNINISFMTIQNEPNARQSWESCLYSPEEEILLATQYIYPTFKRFNIDTQLLIWDHNKDKLLSRSIAELSNISALNSISGIALHYYTGDHFENIELLKQLFPNKLIFHTEGCTGYSKFRVQDEVKNAEIYAHDILGDLNAGINAYIDWNLALDYKGGPNHKNNFCNAPIMINKFKSNYIKNLSFYYIGQFSKFIHQNSKRIAFSKFSTDIEVTAFKNPDNSIAIVLLNRNNFNKEYNLVIENTVIHDNLDSHAIVSYLVNFVDF